MIARRKFRTKEARRRERLRLILKSSIAILVSALLLALLVYSTHIQTLRVKHVFTQTSGILDAQEIISVIETELEGLYLKSIPKDSIFILRYRNLEKVVMQHFPRIENIEIKRVNVYTINASVVERSPAALWCGDLVPPVAHEESRSRDAENSDIWGKCFLMDTHGLIYAKAPHFSGNLYPRYYGSLEHAEPIAQQYIPEANFQVWQNFYQAINVKNIVIQAILFVDERDVEAYLTNGIQVLIPRDGDIDMITQRLIAVLESDELNAEKEVEYVDLRFGKKAFIKYYGEKLENAE